MPRLIAGSRLVVVAVDVRVEEGVGPEQRLHSAADIRMVEDALDVRHRGEQVVARVPHFVDDAVDLLADGLVHGLPGERRLDHALRLVPQHHRGIRHMVPDGFPPAPRPDPVLAPLRDPVPRKAGLP